MLTEDLQGRCEELVSNPPKTKLFGEMFWWMVLKSQLGFAAKSEDCELKNQALEISETGFR